MTIIKKKSYFVLDVYKQTHIRVYARTDTDLHYYNLYSF